MGEKLESDTQTDPWQQRKEMQRMFEADSTFEHDVRRAWQDRDAYEHYKNGKEFGFFPNIADFMESFPNEEAFDAWFINGRTQQLEEDSRSEDPVLAEEARRGVEMQRWREDEVFPRIKAVLYSPDSPYKPIVEQEESKLPDEPDPIRRVIRDKLSYQDAPIPDEKKAETLEWSLNSDSAAKYAESLQNLAQTESLNMFAIEQAARGIHIAMLSEADRLGIPVTPYGESITWALWDIGKQYYFFMHPDEVEPGYEETGNPLESQTKSNEIINRHLGWEAYAAFQANSQGWREKVAQDPKLSAALELLNKPPKQNNTLSSSDLAELGKRLRSA